VALTDEQRAMLQLLLEGGQSYADIGSLLGITADEVRSRANAALGEVAGADPDAQVPISDYLLGQADPIGRADAVRHLQSDPEANARAERLVAQLRLLAPRAQLPEIPAARGGRRAPAPPPPPPAEAPQEPSVAPGPPPPSPPPPSAGGPSIRERVGGALGGSAPSRRQSQIAAGLGAGALLIIVLVLAVSGVFGGDDDGGDGGDSTGTATATTAANEELAIVPLAPLEGDSSAQGQAVFGSAGDQPVLQINLTGLQQAGKGETYIVWLYNSETIAFPLARDQANQQGNLTGAAPVPQEIVPLLPQFGCIDVSLASSRETAATLEQAAQGQTLPRHSGRSILRGEIPRPGSEPASGAASNCEITPAQAGGEGGAGAGQSTTPTQ
jgi:hypothetical protein